ncbi:MAG: hypothetical protein ACYDCC_16490 [Actinomycetota bacterium]
MAVAFAKLSFGGGDEAFEAIGDSISSSAVALIARFENPGSTDCPVPSSVWDPILLLNSEIEIG